MPAANTLTTMVVDDQLTIRSLVRMGLEKLGITKILEAADGEEGLRVLLKNAADVKLIICDYNMPKFDGLFLLRAVRMHEPTSKTAFIMLTGRADPDSVKRAKEHGVNNYLIKPFTEDTLRAKIQAVVGALT